MVNVETVPKQKIWENRVPFTSSNIVPEQGLPGGSVVKNPPANAGDTGHMSTIPGLGRSPGGGNGNPLQWAERAYTRDSQP